MTSLFTAPDEGRTPDPSLAHRRADATVTLHGPDGAPLAGHDVVVRQTRHAFLFGCIGFDLMDLANGTSQDPEYDGRLADAWFDVFNQTTLPFYWGTFEPERGAPTTERAASARRAGSPNAASWSRGTRWCGTRSSRAGSAACPTPRWSASSGNASGATSGRSAA